MFENTHIKRIRLIQARNPSFFKDEKNILGNSRILSGEGIAQQRLEIVRGFKESVEDFKKSLDTVTHEEIMQFVLMTQYFDTLTAIGANENNNTVMVPHTPGGMKDFQQQIIEGTFVGKELSKTKKS